MAKKKERELFVEFINHAEMKRERRDSGSNSGTSTSADWPVEFWSLLQRSIFTYHFHVQIWHDGDRFPRGQATDRFLCIRAFTMGTDSPRGQPCERINGNNDRASNASGWVSLTVGPAGPPLGCPPAGRIRRGEKIKKIGAHRPSHSSAASNHRRPHRGAAITVAWKVAPYLSIASAPADEYTRPCGHDAILVWFFIYFFKSCPNRHSRGFICQRDILISVLKPSNAQFRLRLNFFNTMNT